jgi:hypothetical protein
MRIPVKLLSAAALVLVVGVAGAQGNDVRGAWKADTYVLKDGATHHVEGLMIFSETDWTVVYFVKDDDGQPQRGAGEGGPYTLDGDKLVLTRDYLVIAGNEIGELREIPLRFDIPAVTDPVIEPCRIEFGEGRITIEFPSGNRMGFRRSSGP